MKFWIKRSPLILLSAALLITSINCSRARYRYPTNMGMVSTAKSNGLEVSLVWMKQKGDSLDILLSFDNQSDKNFTVKSGGILVSADKQRGALRGAGQVFEIVPGQRAKELFIFQFDPVLRDPKSAQIRLTQILKESKKQKTLTMNLPLETQYLD